MKALLRRALALSIAGIALASAVSGCVVVPEHSHEGYYEHDHRYWDR